MRFLGIDYGAKRIGIAVSDDDGRLAFPKEIIQNDREVISKIVEIIEEGGVEEVVVGESLDFLGEANPISREIERFVSKLQEKFLAKIHREKEFLTSVEARKQGESKASFQKSGAHSKMKKEKTGRADAGAAALILQRFLDRRSRQQEGQI